MIGITGTRNALSPETIFKLKEVLNHLYENKYISTFHHGDCVGADAYGAAYAKEIGYYIVGHPPEDDKFQAFFKSHESREPKPYLERNKDIVNESKVIISIPRKAVTLEEILNCENGTRRGGTYYTTRYALKSGKEVIMILPDGATLTK